MCGNSENVTVHLMIQTLKDQLGLLISIDPVMAAFVYHVYGLRETDSGFFVGAITLYFAKTCQKKFQQRCTTDL